MTKRLADASPEERALIRAKTRARNRAYRREHIDALREYNRKWHAAHPDYRRERVRKNPSVHIFDNARARAKRLGLPFSLTRDTVEFPEKCPVLGVRLKYHSYRANGHASASLDRIDPKRGYVPDNVRVISLRANQIKTNATVSEVESVLLYMKTVGAP